MTTWDLEGMQRHLFICNGGTCTKAGAEEITNAIRNEISNLQINHLVHTTKTKCNGRCKDKCIVISYPDATWYQVPNTELGRQLVKGTISASHIIYKQSDNGLVKVLESAVKGVSKEEETF